jgi:Carboxypeptidase regulatory-like domain
MGFLRVRFGIILAAVVVFSASVFAQSLTTGDILGAVTDPSGATIPNASVTLKNIDTGASQSTTTNQSGEYRFTLLKPADTRLPPARPAFRLGKFHLVLPLAKLPGLI